jgi:hypothetical protein
MSKFYGRGKNTIQHPYVLPDFYKDYIKDIPIDSTYYVTYNEYAKIVGLFYKEVSSKIINEGELFRMPFRLGDTYIEKKKLDYNNRPPIDWQMTTQHGKVIYNFNEHSDGYKYEMKWSKLTSIFHNLYLYRLVYTRTNKRKVAKCIKEKTIDYFEK